MFWLEFQLWELWPAGNHIVNILLHSCNAILLWRVIQTLAIPGPLFIAAIFALHPVHVVESVAWITEQKNTLSGLLYLSSLLCYLRFSSGFFIGALLSKTVNCSLPAVLLLVRWWKTGNVRGKDLVYLLPMFSVGLLTTYNTAGMEVSVVCAMGKDWDLSLIERILGTSRALWLYASALLWPTSLTFTYPKWEINASSWWQYVFPVSVAGLGVGLALLQGKIGRSPLVAMMFYRYVGPSLGVF